MDKKNRYIFVFVFILSVFSLTLQSSVINLCKENKAFFKNQNQQNPTAEEEEESHDNDESSKEVEYLSNHYFSLFNHSITNFNWHNLLIDFPSSIIKIPIPPPKKLN